MKVIFLDFDGVILTMRTSLAYRRGWSKATCDAVLVECLNACCQQGVKIVVSSTWREIGERAIEKLKECGLDGFLHEDWRTKVIRAGQARRDRPEEVAEWLARHMEVKEYRILDDDPWEWNPDQAPHFLKCDAEDGASGRVLKDLMEWSGARPRLAS